AYVAGGIMDYRHSMGAILGNSCRSLAVYSASRRPTRADHAGDSGGAQPGSHALLLRADSFRGHHGDGRPVSTAVFHEAHGQSAVLGVIVDANCDRSADSVLVGNFVGATSAGSDLCV